MQADSRLSRMLHVLLHMARQDAPFTSERIGRMLDTNPAVVRRTLAGLRKAGYVASVPGRGGGWRICVDLSELTIGDIHRAVGESSVFALHVGEPESRCAVQRAVSGALAQTLQEAQALIRRRFEGIKLSELIRDFDAICRAEIGAASGPGSGA